MIAAEQASSQRVTVSEALADSKILIRVLDQWAQADWLRWLDVEVVRFLWQQTATSEPASPLLLLAAALCSHQNGHGHACLDLAYCLEDPDQALALPPDRPHGQPDVLPKDLLAGLTLEQWRGHLAHAQLIDAGTGNAPLVLVDDPARPLLYLRRFWRYEQAILHQIEKRLETSAGSNGNKAVDPQQLRNILDSLFPDAQDCDWQKIACANALRNRFAIITGGPGTGKTTTVMRLLIALQQSNSSDRPLRIRLAAPTGKAAVRLSESISSQRERISRESDDTSLPSEVTTLHRLLGPIPNSRQFRHHAGNPLPADVVVIDEASMVDIELFAQLLDALPDACRLVLLGDKDQLASVEAGAVLGSLCARADAGHYSASTIAWLTSTTGQQLPASVQSSDGQPIDQAITMLRFSYRFGRIPGIGALAGAINRQQDSLLELFDGRYPELQALRLQTSSDNAFRQLILDPDNGYGRLLKILSQQPAITESRQGAEPSIWDCWAQQVLKAFDGFRVLAAVRRSEFGTIALNQRIESILRSTDMDSDVARYNTPALSSETLWYRGRAIMLTRNDYNLKLMNGDIGIVLPCPDAEGRLRLRVAFPGKDGEAVRWVSPTRLQSVETAFAMTVHKSQGSEFAHTALVLPGHDVPILTRELIYTAVTRASRQFTLIQTDPDILARAVRRRVTRQDGLNRAYS
ncbi:MAG: exodeoxyribonuclease V subunit alpha [Pseudomonadota bacterium]|nr:exodeoxyribonuclease V subunit alpha [Pseudomonadota bacterium]